MEPPRKNSSRALAKIVLSPDASFVSNLGPDGDEKRAPKSGQNVLVAAQHSRVQCLAEICRFTANRARSFIYQSLELSCEPYSEEQ
jgi:hypothetical protein